MTKRSSLGGLIVAAMVGVLILSMGGALMIALTFRDQPPPATFNVPSEDEETIQEARKAVLSYLKWPDDATFLGDETVKQDEVKPRYFHVNGKVKAANELGASLTHRYTVQVRRSEHGKWSTHLVMLGDKLLLNEPWPK